MQLNVYITQKCNFRCLHCLDQCPASLELPFEVYRTLLHLYQPAKVFLTGGEPALHSDFEKIAHTTYTQGIPFSLVSNGSLLDRYQFLFRYRPLFKQIHLSVNGLEETHDRVRKPGSFAQILRAIEFYQSHQIEVILNYQVVRGGEQAFEAVISFFAQRNIQKIRVGAIIRNEVNTALVLPIEVRKALFEKIPTLSRKYKISISTSPSLFSLGGVEMCKVLSDRTVLDIDVQGYFSFCCNLRLGLGRYAKIGEPLQAVRAKRDVWALKMREDRLRKLLLANLSLEDECTCAYCNRFFGDQGMPL